jgi:predicted ester cyclase
MSNTTEQNKRIYREFIQLIFNEGRFEELERLVSPDYVLHGAPVSPGPGGIREAASAFRNGFPDLSIEIEELIAEGDILAARATTRGTHRGMIYGLAGTGKSITMGSLTMVRILDGRLRESWVRSDVMGLMEQLK